MSSGQPGPRHAAAPAAPVSPPTRAEWVDGLLRRAILSGELRPGDKLRGEQLGREWGVSATPLRESFQRLAGEGLVVIEPQRGARVAPIDASDAVELYEIRLLLDPVALRLSIDAARVDRTDEYVADVDAAHRALLRRGLRSGDLHEAHRAFHLALIDRCPNRHLLRQVESLLDQTQRFQAVARRSPRVGDAVAEHAELAEAAMRGDTERAVAVLTAHLRGTLDAAGRATV